MAKNIETPIISVIIPIYNTEEDLEECLDCILNQTFKEIEVICINDKSENNYLNILKNYAKEDSRIKIISFNENLGQSAARNEGIKISKGKYIYFIDSDDKIDLNTLEELYNFIEKHAQDMVLFDVVRLEDDIIKASELHEKSIPQETIIKTNILEHPEFVYDTGIWNKLINSKFLKSNDIKFLNGRIYEDLLFSMELHCAAKSVGVYPKVKYYWRRRETSKKSTTQKRTESKNINDRIFISQKIIELFNSSQEYKKLIDAFYHKLIDLDFRLYMNKIDDGDEEYIRIIQDEIVPFIKDFDKKYFENIDEYNKAKYKLLINGDIESLVAFLKKEHSYQERNKELRKEIKVLKSTKGWFNYKTDNIKTRFIAKVKK